MSRIRHIRRLAGVLAAPAALASTSPGRTRPLSWAGPPLPLRHGAGPVPVHQVPARIAATGGPWQIALIAAAAAVAVAAVMVLRDRAGRAPHDGPGGRPGEAAARDHPGNLRPAGRQAPTHRSR